MNCSLVKTELCAEERLSLGINLLKGLSPEIIRRDGLEGTI
jgi:hypothetical protein